MFLKPGSGDTVELQVHQGVHVADASDFFLHGDLREALRLGKLDVHFVILGVLGGKEDERQMKLVLFGILLALLGEGVLSLEGLVAQYQMFDADKVLELLSQD